MYGNAMVDLFLAECCLAAQKVSSDDFFNMTDTSLRELHCVGAGYASSNGIAKLVQVRCSYVRVY